MSQRRSPRMSARIVIIDDEESVRDSFCSVLTEKSSRTPEKMRDAAAVLFGESQSAPPIPQRIPFQVDTAPNGKAAIQLVKDAVEEANPYAVIFCDIRMPGINGVETVEHIRQIDQRAEVVFVTAYSDHSLDTIIERAGANVGYFVKPFQGEEVHQLATKLATDWIRARELEDLVKVINNLSGGKEAIDTLLQHILQQICMWMEADAAAMFERKGDRTSFRIGVGDLVNAEDALGLLARTKSLPAQGYEKISEDVTLLAVPGFGVALAHNPSIHLTPDRFFLLEMFLQHAAMAVERSEIKEELNHAERMATIGRTLGFLAHDLRRPISSAMMLMNLLQSGISVPEWSTSDIFDKVEDSLQSALLMMADVLDFSKGDFSVNREPVDLAALMAKQVQLWELVAKRKDIELTYNADVAIPAEVDSLKLLRAFENLFYNAVDALENAQDKQIIVSVALEAGEVIFALKDSGDGLPDSLAERVAEPFVTSHKGHGAGFGLAIVKEIATAHGGSFTYQREGALSVFSLRLPAQSHTQAAPTKMQG